MGLKDHLEDGTGHILDLGLDLDYLHVEGSDRPASLSTTAGSGLGALEGAEAEAGGAHCSISSASSISSSSTSSTSTSSSCSNLSEESAACESEDERVQNDIGSKAAQKQPPGEPVATTDPLTGNHTKMEFALKLGYSEELVLLVLGKLGPGALINDILGELVKLGTKTEMEQGAGSASCQSLSSSLSSSSTHSSSSSLLDSYRLACPSQLQLLDNKEILRPVVVDGSNVAMSHGNKEVFSCHGIQLAVDWFLERGHRDVTVFVPAWRKEQSRPDALITDQEILRRLEKEKILVFTPSRRVQGRRVVCYDDRFIVKLAYESDGIIVSNDNYRDLANEKPEWKKFIDERLLMYSFVNDKFMPPDDPLGRHGPSLENFLRKTPIIPEHRKQPCPYGKKCTYGHKCKFYHPERGTQPQRSVADELRASAKTSSSSKSQGDAPMVKSHSFPSSARPDRAADSTRHPGPPKRQSDTNLRTDSYTDLMEDRLGVRTRVETCRGSSSSSCSSNTLATASGGPLSVYGYQQDWRDHTGEGGSSRAVGASGLCPGESYPRCGSPELSYPSLMRAYSGLSLVVPQSPERYFPADLRAGSLPSDCSSEGSVSSDSFSPDPLLEDGLKCQHQHHHLPLHSHHHHCPSRYPQPSTHAPPGLAQHPHHGYALSQGVGRLQGFNLEDPASSYHHFKAPQAYMLSPLQVRSGCPGDYPLPPSQTSSPHVHSQRSPGGHSLLGSAWQDKRPPDSRLYERSSLHPRRSYPGQEQHIASWDPRHHLPPQPCYEPFSIQSLPEGREQPCHSPWARGTHSPRMTPSLPPAPPSHPTHPSSSAPQPQDRYQDLREKVFLNLCNIFPPEQVRVVMARNPHVSDAQQLAAAILVEKSQHGY